MEATVVYDRDVVKAHRIHEASQVAGSTGGFLAHSSLDVSGCFFSVLVCDGYKAGLLGCV